MYQKLQNSQANELHTILAKFNHKQPQTMQTLSNSYKHTNNPFNIRGTDKWQGKIGINQSKFVVFDTLQNGLRAGIKNLRTEIVINKNNTIEKLISEYAPKSDNNKTEAYIQFVSKELAIPRNQKLTVDNIDKLGKAILKMEHGYIPEPTIWEAALKSALSGLKNVVVNTFFLILSGLLQRLVS